MTDTKENPMLLNEEALDELRSVVEGEGVSDVDSATKIILLLLDHIRDLRVIARQQHDVLDKILEEPRIVTGDEITDVIEEHRYDTLAAERIFIDIVLGEVE